MSWRCLACGQEFRLADLAEMIQHPHDDVVLWVLPDVAVSGVA